MERFLTNFKQKCHVEPSNEGRKNKRQKYETEKRKRDFIPSWSTTYTWLENGSNGMTCTICTKYEKTGTFITGCKNYKRDTINQHEKSEAHQFNVIKYNGQQNPENSEGARALRTMNQLQVNRMALLFRNVFACTKKGRPYTDFPMLCDLDESKGLDIGNKYRNNKKAAEFVTFISKAENNKIRTHAW